MSYESLSLSELIPATEDQIYSAWLSSNEHSAFTGDQAEIDPVIGGRHSTFNGYAQGAIVDLIPGRRIVQTWRTNDFPEGSPDSRLELTLEATVGGTMVTLLHTEIPGGQSDNYREGWVKYYFDALKKYFAEKTDQTPGSEEPTAVLTPPSNGLSEHKQSPASMTTRAKTPSAKPAAKAAAKPKAKAKAKAKVVAKAKAKTKVKAKAKATAKSKPKARPAAKAKARKAIKARGKVKPKAKAKAKAKAKPKAKAKAARKKKR